MQRILARRIKQDSTHHVGTVVPVLDSHHRKGGRWRISSARAPLAGQVQSVKLVTCPNLRIRNRYVLLSDHSTNIIVAITFLETISISTMCLHVTLRDIVREEMGCMKLFGSFDITPKPGHGLRPIVPIVLTPVPVPVSDRSTRCE